MKKAILIFAALLMGVSGVAAVSAYEAHVINVTATVENALDVDVTDVEFGVMFPQEWNKIKRKVMLSLSAIGELPVDTSEPPDDIVDPVTGDLDSVTFKVWAEWKEDVDSVATPDVLYPAADPTDYYAWIGEWLWVAFPEATQTETDPMSIPSEWYCVGTAPVMPIMAKEILGTSFTLNDDSMKYIDIMFLAPCFEDYYNSNTDVKPDWWPSEVESPPAHWPIPPWPLILDTDDRYLPGGVDLGCDIKIQVSAITRH